MGSNGENACTSSLEAARQTVTVLELNQTTEQGRLALCNEPEVEAEKNILMV